MSKDIFVLNPFELNLDKEIGEKKLNHNFFNLIIEINQEREGSIPPSLLIEFKRESTSIPISINSLIQLRDLPIVILKDL